MLKNQKVKIMVFGTFDIVHKGHVHFFGQARKLAKNPFLIVSIARDANVTRIKGKKPVHNERLRLQTVKKNTLVDRVVLGAMHNYLAHIVKEKPGIIALGYDQKNYTEGLREKLAQKGLAVKVVKLKPHRPHIYKTSKLVHNREKK